MTKEKAIAARYTLGTAGELEFRAINGPPLNRGMSLLDRAGAFDVSRVDTTPFGKALDAQRAN